MSDYTAIRMMPPRYCRGCGGRIEPLADTYHDGLDDYHWAHRPPAPPAQTLIDQARKDLAKAWDAGWKEGANRDSIARNPYREDAS